MSISTVIQILVLFVVAFVLLFPVVFRFKFCLSKLGFEASLFIFKKKIWNRTRENSEDEEFVAPEATSNEPFERGKEKKSSSEIVETYPAKSESKIPEEDVAEPALTESSESVVEKESSVAHEDKPSADDDALEPAKSFVEEPAEKTKKTEEDLENDDSGSKPEKKKLTDREFWTLLLSPDIDKRGFRYLKRILKSFVDIFCVRFIDCYVEGIRMDYKSMGYGASLNAVLKGYPFLEDWDLRMDWTRDHELQSAGLIEVKVTLCRILWFIVVSLVHMGIFALVFWRRRAHVLKTGQLPELGFFRKRILNWLVPG